MHTTDIRAHLCHQRRELEGELAIQWKLPLHDLLIHLVTQEEPLLVRFHFSGLSPIAS